MRRFRFGGSDGEDDQQGAESQESGPASADPKPGDETSIMLQCRVAGAALPVVVMPEEDLSDLLAVSPAEPPPPASPVAAAPAAPSEDVFFMEEPAAPAAAAPPPPSPPPPAEDNLFFVEEPFDASASPPAAAAPVRPAPAPEPPPVPPPKASAAAKPAPPPIRRHGPTPPPSAAPERDDEAEPLLWVALLDIGDQLDTAFLLHPGVRAAAVAVDAAALVRPAGHARPTVLGVG